jgi:capsular polysaccharide biosynthesis protein
MSVSAYVRRILARWRSIAVAATVVTLGALLLTVTAEPVYSSHAQLYVASAGDDSDLEAIIADGVQVKGRALSYAAVANSEAMALAVIDDLDLEDSPGSVAGRVSAEVPFATVLINLTARGDSPAEANALAGAVVDNYNDVLAEIESADLGHLQVQVATLAEPSLPGSATTPRPVLNLLAGLFAGLMLGVALAVLRDLFDQRIRRADDVRGLGLVPLGTVTGGEGLGGVRDAVLAATAGSTHRAVVVTPLHDGLADVADDLTDAFAAADYRAHRVEPTPGPDGERQVAGLRETYDVLVVAAPHGLMLAAAADGAILVLEAGKIDRDDLAETTRQYADAGARVLGVLLVEPRS